MKAGVYLSPDGTALGVFHLMECEYCSVGNFEYAMCRGVDINPDDAMKIFSSWEYLGEL